MQIGFIRRANVESNRYLDFEEAKYFIRCEISATYKSALTSQGAGQIEKVFDGIFARIFERIFAWNVSELGTTTKAEHLIDTGKNHPIKRLSQRLPNVLRKEVDKQVGEMLEKDVIRPSKSLRDGPIVLVKKEDGTWVEILCGFQKGE